MATSHKLRRLATHFDTRSSARIRCNNTISGCRYTGKNHRHTLKRRIFRRPKRQQNVILKRSGVIRGKPHLILSCCGACSTRRSARRSPARPLCSAIACPRSLYRSACAAPQGPNPPHQLRAGGNSCAVRIVSIAAESTPESLDAACRS